MTPIESLLQAQGFGPNGAGHWVSDEWEAVETAEPTLTAAEMQEMGIPVEDGWMPDIPVRIRYTKRKRVG